jgi:glycosyltransferase involved in cell wall biosynthesis
MLVDAPVKAKVKVLWVHDIHCGGSDAAMHRSLLKYDLILCLSDWHKQFFLQTYPFLDPNKVTVTRNGIKTERFAAATLERKKTNKLIYTSSANRGLETLLQWFPAIKSRVPDVTLDVYYGFDTWRAAVRGHQQSLDEINALENLAKATDGVSLKGRVNQTVLAEAFMDSKVWAYPTMFTETSCISAMEAQAAGCLIVTTEVAALGETVKHGILIGTPTGEQYKKIFVDSVVAGLRGVHSSEQLAAIEHGRTLGWDVLAKDWVTLFENLTAQVQDLPMHNYVSSQP